MEENQGSWKKPPEVEAILAIGSLVLFSYAMWYVVNNIVPKENEKYAMLMLGALIGVVKDTFGRYFTSTKGAQEQRKEAAQVAATLATTAATVAATAATGGTTTIQSEHTDVTGSPVTVTPAETADPEPDSATTLPPPPGTS